jgi:hypothetical protein
MLLLAPSMSSSSSFFHLREIQSISETGTPFGYDPLTWGGRQIAFSPLFHYFMAFVVSFTGTDIAVKFVPALVLSISVVAAYLLSRRVTSSKWASLLGAAAVIPVLIHAADLSPRILAIPLMMLITYYLIDLDNSVVPFLVCLAILAFLDPVSLVWLGGLAIYLVLMVAENLTQQKGELEIGLFAVLFVIWAHLILYKRVLVEHGFGIIWQNVPAALLGQYFTEITLFEAITLVGILPSLAAAYVIWKFLFKEKNKNVYIIMGMIAAAVIIVWWKIISPLEGMIIAGVFRL